MIHIITNAYEYEEEDVLMLDTDMKTDMLATICINLEFMFEYFVSEERSLCPKCLLKILTTYFNAKDMRKEKLVLGQNPSDLISNLDELGVLDIDDPFLICDYTNEETEEAGTLTICELFELRELTIHEEEEDIYTLPVSSEVYEEIKQLIISEGDDLSRWGW